MPEGWRDRLENHSAPYTSTIVFLVRKGNPKNIKDWDDLVKADVAVITPHPKDLRRSAMELSGGMGICPEAGIGRLEEAPRSRQAEAVAKAQEKAREFVGQLYHNVLVLDSGARRDDHFRQERPGRRASGLGE